MFGKVEGTYLIIWRGVSGEVEGTCLINWRCVCLSDEACMRNATNCGAWLHPRSHFEL